MIAWLRVPVSALRGRVSAETTANAQLPIQAKEVTGILWSWAVWTRDEGHAVGLGHILNKASENKLPAVANLGKHYRFNCRSFFFFLHPRSSRSRHTFKKLPPFSCFRLSYCVFEVMARWLWSLL